MENRIRMSDYARLLSGLDPFLYQPEVLADPQPNDNYPAFNIERIGESRYRVELAVAGFTDDDLSITVEANQLTVSGNKLRAAEKGIVYQGIPNRPFTRRFGLADHLLVKAAKLTDGLLTIELEREVPESAKPRRIEIENQVQTGAHRKRAA